MYFRLLKVPNVHSKPNEAQPIPMVPSTDGHFVLTGTPTLGLPN